MFLNLNTKNERDQHTFLENLGLSSTNVLSLGWKVLIPALTCEEKEEEEVHQWGTNRTRSIIHVHHIQMTRLILTGLKITSSSKVMLPFDRSLKSSFFRGKAICCPLWICKTKTRSRAEPKHQWLWNSHVLKVCCGNNW